jgi:hypothetical protein
MKSPKTKSVVILAISLVFIIGIFVFAESPAPKVSGQDNPVQLVMACVPVDKTKLTNAENSRPSDTYRIQYGSETAVGTLPPTSCPPTCASPASALSGNATQRATFGSTQELRAFLDKAGL